MKLLDGRKLATDMLVALKSRVAALPFVPGFAVIVVGADPASAAYVRQKKLAAETVGVRFTEFAFPETVTLQDLLIQIAALNQKESIHGIIVQLPLPAHINVHAVLSAIAPGKDVDGFHPANHGQTLVGDPRGIAPATPAGIVTLLDHYAIPLEGKEVVIVGHSNIVGKPLAVMLMNRNATVTVCHKFTADLAAHTKKADILISATGVPRLIKAAMVKKDAIVIDVGCAKCDDKLVGDVDFEKVATKTSYITPVPGGVGPMTVATLISNVVRCAEATANAMQPLRRATDAR